MDAHCISPAGRSRRKTSRIYEDLKAVLGYSSRQPQRRRSAKMPDHVEQEVSEMLPGGLSPHLCIVGAGLAGLRCADILLQFGFRVTILEGRQRLGGRLYQERLPNGHLVDAGPNWIHGTAANPIFDIARQTDTTVDSNTTQLYLYDQHGHPLPPKDGENHSTKMWQIVEDAFTHSNKHSNAIDPNESLHDFFRQQLPKAFPDSTKDFKAQREILLQLAEGWGAFVGGPIKRQSLKFCFLEECLEGENLFCAGTYANILESIATPAIKGADIRYGRTVSRIRMRDHSKDSLHVVTTGGEEMEFDGVVLTAPLGCLKRKTIAFDPSFPPRLCKAIESIGYGSLEKVYISFPKAFWATPGEDGQRSQGFYQWLAPNYALDSNPQRWAQEAINLASLPPPAAHPTLLFYIFGDQSELLTGAVGKLATKTQKDTYLYAHFRPYYSRLPSFDAASQDCQPSGCFATDFLHDELAGNGGYTNFQVGLEEGDEDIRVMRQGLPGQGLWLAGEHTAPFVALGTSTGAYWSGELVARRIAEAYGCESKPMEHRPYKTPAEG